MKYKGIIRFCIIYFLLINTGYFWEGIPGLLQFGRFVFLLIGFPILFVVLTVHGVYSLKERFANRYRSIAAIVVLTVLVLTCLFPRGLIDFSRFESPDLITAQSEGTMNMKYIQVKEDGCFVFKISSFGLVTKYKGTYQMQRDTIRFNFDGTPYGTDKHTIGVLKLNQYHTKKYIGGLNYYGDSTRKSNLTFLITKFELK